MFELLPGRRAGARAPASMNWACAIYVGVMALCTLSYCVHGLDELHAARGDGATAQRLIGSLSKAWSRNKIKCIVERLLGS